MLASFLRARRQSIVREWRARLRQLIPDNAVSDRTLVDHVPEIVDNVVAVLKGEASDPSRPHENHAYQRLVVGAGLAQVVEEYALLRRCILDLCEREGRAPTPRETTVLHCAIDRMIAEAAAHYSKTTERRAVARDRAERRPEDPLCMPSEESRTEDAQRFLAAARATLAESLDSDTTLRTVANLAVPNFADWATVHLLDPDGRIVPVAAAHTDPERVAYAKAYQERFQPDLNATSGPGAVLRTGQAEWEPSVTDAKLAAAARDDAHLRALRSLDIGSYIFVPMVARGRILGALGFIAGRSTRRFDEADFQLAKELARTAAFAVDNARLYGQAREAVRLRDQVLAVVSHDLRNPLATVRGVAELLARTLPARPPELRLSVERLHRATHRMERLIADLLDMVSIRAGRLSLNRRTEDPATLVRAAVEEHLAATRDAKIVLETRIETAGLRVVGDRDRILQVFGNLIANALRFTAAGETIRIDAVPDGPAVRFSVTDTGPGIPSADRNGLFEPYVAAGDASKRGTGLGLFIARGIVEGHGGQLWMTPVVPTGTTFSFTLPSAPPEP